MIVSVPLVTEGVNIIHCYLSTLLSICMIVSVPLVTEGVNLYNTLLLIYVIEYLHDRFSTSGNRRC